jgi:hypothetical protein
MMRKELLRGREVALDYCLAAKRVDASNLSTFGHDTRRYIVKESTKTKGIMHAFYTGVCYLLRS